MNRYPSEGDLKKIEEWKEDLVRAIREGEE